RFGNPTAPPGFLTGLFHRVLADGLPGPITREEPRGRSLHSPPRSEQLQQLRREHHVAILLALPLVDPNDHAAAIDVSRSQMEDLRNTQACRVAGRENRAMLG